jgi:hypothetical protein
VEAGSNTSMVTLQVPRDSDQRKTALARSSSICKRQTERAPHINKTVTVEHQAKQTS